MKKVEYLLTCLAEECAEVQQIISKAQRFGLDNHHPKRTETNLEELKKELAHIDAVRHLLEYDAHVPVVGNAIMTMTDKIESVRRYMDVSRDCGILEADK